MNTSDTSAQRAFRSALGQFATGVTIVTTNSENGPLGITANSFSSVSLDPPLVLWSPARASRRFAAFEAAQHFAIHVLSAEQEPLCAQFSRDGYDFGGLDWQANSNGVPQIAGALARFDCTKEAAYDGGDHLIILGRVTSVARTDGQPLIFAQGKFCEVAPPV